MKYLLIFIMILISTQSYGKKDKRVEIIRKWFKDTNYKAENTKVFPVFKMNDSTKSTEGGTITAYISKKQFKKIKVEYLFETGKYNAEFYFHDNILFFVYTKRTYYNAPIYLTKVDAEGEAQGVEAFDPKKSSFQENRYYFNNKKLIRWIDKKRKQIDPNSKVAKDKEVDIKKELKEYITKIKKELF